jgi:predicted DCC family thiol-disulfide oxidoreductase YuxK
MNGRVTIYYDASCPLCAGEMEALQSRAADGAFVLVDCSTPGFDDAAFAPDGITRAAMMSRIHARDPSGRWLRGLDVFAFAYRAAGFRRLARFYAWSPVRPFLDRVYGWIADHRNGLSRFGLSRLFRRLAR